VNPLLLPLEEDPISMDTEATFVVNGQGWKVVKTPAKIQLPAATKNSFIFPVSPFYATLRRASV